MIAGSRVMFGVMLATIIIGPYIGIPDPVQGFIIVGCPVIFLILAIIIGYNRWRLERKSGYKFLWKDLFDTKEGGQATGVSIMFWAISGLLVIALYILSLLLLM